MKDKVQVHDLTFVPYITASELDSAIKTLALQIKSELKDMDPLFVCIMNGAFMFAGELLSHIDEDYEVAFAQYSSYCGTSSTNQLKEVLPLKVPIKDRVIIIIEDLIDTGFTMKCLKDKYINEGAKAVYIATMLLKREALINSVEPDFVGIEIKNKFIVGHGLDYDGRGRLLKDIYILDEN